MNCGEMRRSVAVSTIAPVPPRLLDLPGTAAYLSISEWSVRDLEAAGTLPRVRIPVGPRGELRKLLFDREDLDRCIAIWKESVTPDSTRSSHG
jgi:hypothetical protein